MLRSTTLSLPGFLPHFLFPSVLHLPIPTPPEVYKVSHLPLLFHPQFSLLLNLLRIHPHLPTPHILIQVIRVGLAQSTASPCEFRFAMAYSSPLSIPLCASPTSTRRLSAVSPSLRSKQTRSQLPLLNPMPCLIFSPIIVQHYSPPHPPIANVPVENAPAAPNTPSQVTNLHQTHPVTSCPHPRRSPSGRIQVQDTSGHTNTRTSTDPTMACRRFSLEAYNL